MDTWIQTYGGKKYHFLDPKEEDIEIIDIAHALSMTCRFGGHTKYFYSVAEHCCHMFDLAEDKDKLWALLHDAAEAYLVDMPSPIKAEFPHFKSIENYNLKIIAQKFKLDGDTIPDSVKVLDLDILIKEADELLLHGRKEWSWTHDIVNDLSSVVFKCWSPSVAKVEFLNRFYDYMVD